MFMPPAIMYIVSSWYDRMNMYNYVCTHICLYCVGTCIYITYIFIYTFRSWRPAHEAGGVGVITHPWTRSIIDWAVDRMPHGHAVSFKRLHLPRSGTLRILRRQGSTYSGIFSISTFRQTVASNCLQQRPNGRALPLLRGFESVLCRDLDHTPSDISLAPRHFNRANLMVKIRMPRCNKSLKHNF